MNNNVGDNISPYDLMASVYDGMYRDEMNDRIDEAAIVAGLCANFIPNTKSILDLGAGTGAVLSQLSRIMQLDEMVGIEQSTKMIQEGRKKVPNAEFIHGDITDFSLGRQFDVVTCLFDTMNHIRSGNGWESTFGHAADHLKPGGIFIFDMVTKRLMDGIADLGGYNWKFEGGECLFSIHPIGGGEYRGDFKIVQDKDQENPTELSIVETTFPVVPVLRSLRKALKPIIVFDHDVAVREISEIRPRVTDETTRIMIVAQKPI